VTAGNPYGAWNGQTAELHFTIRPPLHKTWAFYIALAAVTAVLLFAAHRLRLNHLRTRFWAILTERTRIARELHDTLAQGLAGTGIQLEAALSILPGKPEAAREHVALGRAMVRSTLGEVRRSIWVLRTQTSKRADGLAAVLADSLKQLGNDNGLVPRIQLVGEPRELAPEVERNLLRIAHEAVTNAVRHSGASSLDVELAFDRSDVRLRVHDDGRGFDPKPWLSRHRGEHFGLVGLAERVRGLGGELEITSTAGSGTDVICRLPYRVAS
jgi:signal transduction histidine kinase